MKRTLCIIIALAVCVILCSCGETDNAGRSGLKVNSGTVSDTIKQRIDGAKATAAPTDDGSFKGDASAYTGKVDIDLTKMGSTMTYSQVSNFITSPGNYLGKVVRMKGNFTYGVGGDRYYFACIIPDATGCCSQGIEFILKNERQFPDEYPEVGAVITVVGVFDTYMEGKYQYCQLIDAYME
ncbi:MAG: hypothetical protein K6B54_04545 [Clostridia bacterium]|nr:hypothetical protein [Clostridia bacterium]